MQVMLDREEDVAYIYFEDEARPYPDGGSNFLHPPQLPFHIDVLFDGEERLVGVRLEEASKRLHPDALRRAVPFQPFV